MNVYVAYRNCKYTTYMYTQLHRFLATLLLFSLLLQSCGNPNMKMVEPLDTAVNGKPPRPEQAVLQQPTDLGYVAVEAGTPKTEKAPAASSTGFGTLSEQRDSLSKPLPLPAMSSPVSSARRFHTAHRSSSGRQQTPPHVMRQSPHTESGKAPERPLPHQSSGASVVDASHHATQPASSAQRIAHVSQTPSPHRPEAMRRQPSSPTSLPSAESKSYALHQGQQISFQQQSGTWVAQVQDVWGRVHPLPVLCAPHTTPERAIEELSTKAPGQHKYCVHLLETDQPPWAPRVVYVGAMGLRGGMPSTRDFKKRYKKNNRCFSCGRNETWGEICPCMRGRPRSLPRSSSSPPAPRQASPPRSSSGLYERRNEWNEEWYLDELYNASVEEEERLAEEAAAEEAKVRAELEKMEEKVRRDLSQAIAIWENLERDSRAQLDKYGEAIASGKSLLSELHTLHGLGTSHLDVSLSQHLVDLISLLTTTTPSYQRRYEEMEAQLKKTFAYKPQTSGKSFAYLLEHHIKLNAVIHEQRERLETYAKERNFFRTLQENIGSFSWPTNPVNSQAVKIACIIYGIHESIGKKARMEQLTQLMKEQRRSAQDQASEIARENHFILKAMSNIGSGILSLALMQGKEEARRRKEERQQVFLEKKQNYRKIRTDLEESRNEFALLAQTYDQESKTRKLQIESAAIGSTWIHTPTMQELDRPLFSHVRDSSSSILENLWSMFSNPWSREMIYDIDQPLLSGHVLSSPEKDIINLEKDISELANRRKELWHEELGLHWLFGPKGTLQKQREEDRLVLLSRVRQLQASEKALLLEGKVAIHSGPLDDLRAVLAERNTRRHQLNLKKLLVLEALVKNGKVEVTEDTASLETRYPSLVLNNESLVLDDKSLVSLCSENIKATRIPNAAILYFEKHIKTTAQHRQEQEEARRREEERRKQEEQQAQVPTVYESAASVQEDEETLPTPWWGVPFVQPETPEPDLASLLQHNLQLHEPAAEEQAEEDSKMPSFPRATTFDTPEAAQEAVTTFLERWQLETPEGRATLLEQSKEVLRAVEELKKETKQSYRHQVFFGFEAQDVAEIVWERLLQGQQATQARLNDIRALRAQLLEACQIQGAALQEVGIRTVFDEDDQEEVLYTSDEDEQQLSSEEMQEGQALLKDVAIEAGTWIIAPEAKAAQLLLKAGKLLKLGKKIKKAGKVLIQVTDSKVSKEAKRLVGKEGGRMVKKGITSVIKSAGLPTRGKIRFIPRPSDVQMGKILQKNGGYVDKFGNVWKHPKGELQEAIHWDVQLSQVGKQQLGHMSKSGGAHLNVTSHGKIHH